jgi:hypothetical protein
MENQLLTQHRQVSAKVPDIENALQAVKFLISKQKSAADEALSVNYELSDGVYASAKVVPQNQVMLWLGANVMVQYDYNDAEQLLTKNLSVRFTAFLFLLRAPVLILLSVCVVSVRQNARTNIGSLESDLSFLKEQITTTEVNIARVHNFRVAQKQAAAPTKSLATGGSATSQ